MQITLLYIFSTFNSLLDEVEKKESVRVERTSKVSGQSLAIIKTVNKYFSYFIIILAIFILLTGGYLVYLLSSKKRKVETPEIPAITKLSISVKG